MRSYILLFLLIFTSSTFADTVRIAGWNLGGFYQIPESKLERIIEGMRLLDANIIVLSELNPLSHADKIAEELSLPAGICYEAKVPDQPKASQ